MIDRVVNWYRGEMSRGFWGGFRVGYVLIMTPGLPLMAYFVFFH